MNKGFTLIELLVVVLIIGILAAISLPQYQKAIERSRMAKANQVLSDLINAQKIYYLQNGTFADGWEGEGSIASGDMIIVDPSDDGGFHYLVEGDTSGATMTAQRWSGMYGNAENRGQLSLELAPNGTIIKTCSGPDGFCDMAESDGYTKVLPLPPPKCPSGMYCPNDPVITPVPVP